MYNWNQASDCRGAAPFGGAIPAAAPFGYPMPFPGMPIQPGFPAPFPMMPPSVPSGAFVTPGGGNIVALPAVEESYIENILRLNRGKLATVYMTYENNSQWNAKVFKGIVEAAGRDHIILSDPVTGMRFLLLTVNLDYITFDEEIAYEYPFHGGVVTQQTPVTDPPAPSTVTMPAVPAVPSR